MPPTKAFLPPDPPWVSRLLVFLSFPISLPLSCWPHSQSPTCSYNCLVNILHLAPHLHLNPSKMEPIILQLPPDVSYYCYRNTKLSFHRELPLKGSFPLPSTPLLPIQSQGPFLPVSPESITFSFPLQLIASLFKKSIKNPQITSLGMHSQLLLTTSGFLAHNACVPFTAFTTTVLFHLRDYLINALFPNHERWDCL